MNICKLLILLIVLTFTGLNATKAQQSEIPLKTIIENRTKLAQEFPTEKVHLHFDKPYYGLGDTIWFKAYVLIEQHIPSPLSKIIYVDLINQRDSVVESLKLPVVNGVG